MASKPGKHGLASHTQRQPEPLHKGRMVNPKRPEHPSKYGFPVDVVLRTAHPGMRWAREGARPRPGAAIREYAPARLWLLAGSFDVGVYRLPGVESDSGTINLHLVWREFREVSPRSADACERCRGRSSGSTKFQEFWSPAASPTQMFQAAAETFLVWRRLCNNFR